MIRVPKTDVALPHSEQTDHLGEKQAPSSMEVCLFFFWEAVLQIAQHVRRSSKYGLYTFEGE